MADWANLSGTTGYATLLSQISDRDKDAGYAFDPASTTVTNPFTGLVRYNSANKRWEKYNGSTYAELIAAATDAYAITVTGHRGGNFYGSIDANGATIVNGTINATVLQRAGSNAWTAASLTNLSQLTNGPGYLTASALAPYAALASADFTILKIGGNAVATQSYVSGLGYATTASVAAGYAPLGGSGTSGTWPISISGNSVTTSQRTFSNVKTDGVAAGSYGSISVGGSQNNFAGTRYDASSAIFMVHTSTRESGLYVDAGTPGWLWHFSSAGVLDVGSVPWTSVSGRPTDLAAFTNTPGYAVLAPSTQVFSGVSQFLSNKGSIATVGGSISPGLQAFANDGGPAFMSFHRSSAFAVNFGLDTDNVLRIGGWSAAANLFQFDSSGNFTAAGNVVAYSDRRLKKDIEPIRSALARLLKITGVSYTRIATGKHEIGVIAQDVEEAFPEAVSHGAGDDKTLGVAYGNLVGPVIEALREINDRLRNLERVA